MTSARTFPALFLRALFLASLVVANGQRAWADPPAMLPGQPAFLPQSPYATAHSPYQTVPLFNSSAQPINQPSQSVNVPSRPTSLPAHPANVAAQPATAPAQPGVVRLTLDDAKALALNNNKGLILARMNVEEKGFATQAARKDYLPKVIGADTYFRFNDNLGSVVTVQRGRLGILPASTSTIDAAVFQQNSNLATAMVVQQITKLIAVNAAVQLARADQGVAHAQLDKGTRDLLSGVTQAYYGFLGGVRIHNALMLQANLLEQLLSSKPVPELRIGLVETRQGIAQVRGQLRDLTSLLNDLLNMPPCTQYELVDPLPDDPAVRSADEAADRALACNPEVLEAQQGLLKAEAAMKVARMAYLPDINVMGGYANQTAASYIQPNIGFFGASASYTFFEWGKKLDVTRQRQLDIAMAHQNVRVIMDKVQLDARKAYSHFEQTRDEYRLSGEMVQARKDAEKGAAIPALAEKKADTAKAELEEMKAEIAYRVAHAQLSAIIGGH